MKFQEFKELVIARAKDLALEEYELYYECAESTSVSAFQQELNEFSSAVSGGVCFRAIVGGKMGYASTEDLSAESAAALVDKAVENASILESQEKVSLGQGGQTYQVIDRKMPDLPTTEVLIAKALESQKALYAADSAVMDGTATNIFSERMEVAICNSKGLDLSCTRSLSGLVPQAVVSDGKEMSDSYDIRIGDLETMDLNAVAAKVVKKAIQKLGGDVAPTSVCPVVFSPEAMASLLATYSPVFSSENAQKGLSRLNGQEGQVIASPAVTLVDDPFCELSAMPMAFDAEGSPTYKKNIIDGGTLETLLYNLKTANVAGKATTGNGSKGSYNASVGISPFTMYLAPGKYTEEELLRKAGTGVYINSLNGLHAGANPVSGDFSLQSGGFLIENGRKTTPVKSFTVAGNFFQLLKSITAVGSNLEVPNPSGVTGFGSPSVLVETLSIAGK